MGPDATHDLVVVGGGAGGMSAARAATARGRSTALLQDGPVGGDCTFTGCVPSKTLIEHAAHGVSFADAMRAVHDVVEDIAATESADVLRKEGIDVIEGRARFVGKRRLSVGGHMVSGRRVVVATGTVPAMPAIAGLSQSPFLTNETVFDLAELPGSLAILGGGAVGCELAQAFARFGSDVHLFEAAPRLLPGEAPEASAVVAEVLASEGVSIRVGPEISGVEPTGRGAGVRLTLADGSVREVDRLLVAAGRQPVTAELDPAAGGIALDERGYIRTDRHLRTSARGVYAVGDITGRMLLTHAADEMGRVAVRNAFGRLWSTRFAVSAIPRVTFTDPEVASVGLTDESAAPPRARVATVPMSAVDRAITAGRVEGFVTLMNGPRRVLGNVGGGRLLGATIVAPRAGEMIHEVALAMRTGMFTGRLVQTVHAYPTWAMGIRQAAAQFFVEVDGRRARPVRRGGPEAD